MVTDSQSRATQDRGKRCPPQERTARPTAGGRAHGQDAHGLPSALISSPNDLNSGAAGRRQRRPAAVRRRARFPDFIAVVQMSLAQPTCRHANNKPAQPCVARPMVMVNAPRGSGAHDPGFHARTESSCLSAPRAGNRGTVFTVGEGSTYPAKNPILVPTYRHSVTNYQMSRGAVLEIHILLPVDSRP